MKFLMMFVFANWRGLSSIYMNVMSTDSGEMCGFVGLQPVLQQGAL